MTDKQRLKLMKLCEHWASHNDSHVENFQKWHQIATDMELLAVAGDLQKAIDFMNNSTKYLLSAKKKLSLK